MPRSERASPTVGVVSVWALAGVAGAVALGAAAQQLVGFGFALLAMPLLTVLVGPQDAVAVEALGSLVGGGAMAWRMRHLVDRSRLQRMAVGALPGLPLGTLVLSVFPDTALRIGVAVAVLATVVVLARGFHLHGERPTTEVAAGAAAGALGTSIGISGPPIVLVLQAARMEQHRFRATTVAFFTVTNVATVALLLATGLVGREAWPLAVVTIPAAAIGNRSCEGLAARVPPDRFRRLVLVTLVVAAGVALAAAL